MQFDSLDYFAFLALCLAGFWGLRRWGIERDVIERVGVERVGVERVGVEPGRPVRVHVRGTWPRFLLIAVASCVFYAAWNWRYLGLILASTALDYFVGLGLGATERPRPRKALLALSLACNLGLLGAFKYYNFFVDVTEQAFGHLLGVELDLPMLDVLLPVGISFYTFQTMSYSIDVYRRELAPTRNPIDFAFYVMFFPQLVAGPIVRAAEFLPQMKPPPWLTRERVSQGLFLIGLGLLKKAIFSDFISVNLVDRVFDDPAAFSATEVLLGLYGFTLQIYADFSGYTDVARGSGLLFGFELPENFDRPYQARSAADFWRRWHMTLSTWLRDYLYFPLGGSRHGGARTYFNLWVTIFLIGLWHGASWTFVLYGNLQAGAVILNRFLQQARQHPDLPPGLAGLATRTLRAVVWPWNALVRAARRPDGREAPWLDVVRVVLTLHFVVFSRILFRANSLENAGDVTAQLLSGTASVAQIDPDVWRVLLLGFYLHYVPRSQLAWARERFVAAPPWMQGLLLVGVALVVGLFATGGVVPYIYFQF
jgi:D-alanyl-lipoteichoic acid acyltransferase DltB (MBOAT superfamily)